MFFQYLRKELHILNNIERVRLPYKSFFFSSTDRLEPILIAKEHIAIIRLG